MSRTIVAGREALTREQQEQIKRETGKQVSALKLEALEERLAPKGVLN